MSTGNLMLYDDLGRLHCDDGPALFLMGGADVRYMIHGKYHREDGPAITYRDETEHWFIDDIDITGKVICWMEECDINSDWTNWTDHEKVLFKLRFV